MTVNVNVLYVNRGGKCLESIVIKTMQRGHEPHVFGDALRQGLSKAVIVNGQCDVVTQQAQGFEFVIFVVRVAFTSAQNHQANQLYPNLKRRDAFKELGRYVAIRTKENLVRAGIEQHRTARSGERMHVLGKKRDDGWIWQHGEALRSN